MLTEIYILQFLGQFVDKSALHSRNLSKSLAGKGFAAIPCVPSGGLRWAQAIKKKCNEMCASCWQRDFNCSEVMKSCWQQDNERARMS
jgi:hypothetical protein